jgi:hypothetical protein
MKATNVDFIYSVFELVSAYGTVGLSLGITGVSFVTSANVSFVRLIGSSLLSRMFPCLPRFRHSRNSSCVQSCFVGVTEVRSVHVLVILVDLTSLLVDYFYPFP